MTEIITLAHHVGGQIRGGEVGIEQRNPAAPDDLAVRGPEADEAIVREAVVAARNAVEALAAGGIEARADALAAIGRRLMAERDRIGLLIARETGKTVCDARLEVVRAARIFDFFAGEALRNIGERFESTRPGATVEVAHRPIGVVAAITPWNFPIAIPAWKIAPALAFGNAVLWKPSELSSATAQELMNMIAETALPSGAVNMLLGAGAAGKAVVWGGVDAISFTGSTQTGKMIGLAAAEQNIRVQLEMGGVNGLVVLADADIGIALDCAVNGAFFAAGQRCTATSRIIVEESISARFAAALEERVVALRIGDPARLDTQVGPLASPRQKARIIEQVLAVEAEGLEPTIGGAKAEMPHSFFAPSLFDHVPADSLLAREEIFGPVAGLFRVANYEEAIQRLNDSRYGLSAGICTTSLKYAEDFKRRAKAGMLMVNLPTAGVDYHAPFGGVGASSLGSREQGRAARQFYTVVKTHYQLA